MYKGVVFMGAGENGEVTCSTAVTLKMKLGKLLLQT